MSPTIQERETSCGEKAITTLAVLATSPGRFLIRRQLVVTGLGDAGSMEEQMWLDRAQAECVCRDLAERLGLFVASAAPATT